MSNCLIIVPIYKPVLNKLEEYALSRCMAILGEHEIRLIAPEGLVIPAPFNELPVTRFPGSSFDSLQGYNQMMLSPGFYEKFLAYKYILIHQLDALVFRDELTYWCSLGFDYYGAPWINKTWKNKYFNLFGLMKRKVGNGGFCLRKTKTFYIMAKRAAAFTKFIRFGEDIFWCNYGRFFKPGFRIIDEAGASHFAFEEEPRRLWLENQRQMPFGCHAFEKNDPLFWKEQLPDLPIAL